MQVTDDMELLREYAARRSEQAFATIVSRHINLVYSVALRHAGNAHEAQDITQSVFVTLAKKAGSLRQGTVLSGWLFHAARLTANNFLRAETRRARREQEAYMQSTLSDASPNENWNQIAPLLDSAIAGLGEKDRNAIVLRFVEGKDLKEVGQALGASEEAAKKRVSRAVEKLRGFFSRRGIMLSGAALAGAITANAVQSAPAGLAAVVTASALAEGAAVTASGFALMKAALKLMAWTKVKIAVGLGVAALAAYEWQQNDAQTKRVAALQGQLQEAAQRADKQQAAIEKLTQEKQAMVNEKLESERAATKLMARQRAALNAVAAKKAAVAAGADKSNSLASAFGKMMDDPSVREMMRQGQLSQLKTQYAPLLKSLNLTPEAADKFMQLVVDNGLRQMDFGMEVMKGDVDSATMAQQQLAAKNEFATQLQSLLGADGYAQYQQFEEELPARTMLGLFKSELTDNSLTDDQSAQLLALMKAGPKGYNAGQFDTPAAATENYLQQQADNNQKILQQAASFLNPDQLSALAAFQTNMINMQKMGLSMQKEFFGKAGQ